MRIDVVFGAQALGAPELHGRMVVVIDVLRASTSIAVALSHGAKAVIPFETSEEAVMRAKQFDRSEIRLAGERKMHAIPGFDLGNSPAEFTREIVEGRIVLLATTNGTPALVNTSSARDVVVGSYVNFAPVLAMLRAAARGNTDVTIVCAGRDRQFALEDAACAGRFARGVAKRLAGVVMNDAAKACMLIDRRYGDDVARMFADSEHGKALADAGFAQDLELCARLDDYPVVPVYQERQITKLGPERER